MIPDGPLVFDAFRARMASLNSFTSAYGGEDCAPLCRQFVLDVVGPGLSAHDRSQVSGPVQTFAHEARLVPQGA